ncbi:hypothetical protein AB0E01_35020 [Nocardia vinacea]|uniref:hypothetical protein n=1 Tax=Nocardia vinacea TaxID=96468 RepID=UPI0033F7BC18
MTYSQVLAGRVAVVTGVSRRRGIGFAIAHRLAAMGARLYITHRIPHSRRNFWIGQATAALSDLRRGRRSDQDRIGTRTTAH